MTRAQVDTYLKQAPGYRLDPIELAKDGLNGALEWLANQSLETAPVFYATADPASVSAAQEALGVGPAGELLESALGELAIAARAQGARRFVVAGGETSGAVTKALGVRHLFVGPEIAAGVPWTSCQTDGHEAALALKSGNFGGPEFFADAFTKLGTP